MDASRKRSASEGSGLETALSGSAVIGRSMAGKLTPKSELTKVRRRGGWSDCGTGSGPGLLGPGA